MNTYHAFYKGKRIELKADTSYKAQLEAAKQFKVRKGYDVTVLLVAKGDENEPVMHTPDF